MLDEACADDLNRLDGEERTLVAQIKRLFAAQDQVTAIDQQIVSLSQELIELERQWQARKDVQGEAAAYQQAQRAKRYLQGLHDQVEKDIEAVNSATTALCVNADNGAVVADSWPHAEWMTSHTIATSAIRERFKKRLTSLLEEIATESDALFAQNAQRSEVIRTLDAAQLAFVKACEAKGIQTQDVSRLQELDRSKQAKQLALDDKKRERQALDGTAEALEDGLSRLFAVWASQTACRTRVAAEVTKKTGNSIRVSIKPMAYQPHFEKLWMTIEPDRRTRVGREWQVLGETFFQSFSTAEIPPASPWEHTYEVLNDPAKSPEILWQFGKEIQDYVASQTEAWRNFRVTRIPDVVDIELYRNDRSLVGNLEGGQLSEGQRNTAILHMLLVKGDGPIIIDQPEDEVDASFIYKDLVPLLRQAKSCRQLILATHNANLPVNADAEFVFALESVNGRGGVLAQGGLDRRETALAVLDIMEGSEEAFRRRFDKYHF